MKEAEADEFVLAWLAPESDFGLVLVAAARPPFLTHSTKMGFCEARRSNKSLICFAVSVSCLI